jgi:hypothetical protein
VAKLILKSGDKSGMEYELSHGVIIGRELDASIHLNDVKSSRKHAKFETDGEGYAIVDLRSTNGTFVNGKKATRVALWHGDQIKIGSTVFLYFDPASVRPASGPAAAGAQKPAPKKPAAKKFDIAAPPPKKIKGPLKSGRTRRDRLR